MTSTLEDKPTNRHDWNTVYRFVVLSIFILQVIGTGIGIYAARAYIENVASEKINSVVSPLIATVNTNSLDIRSFKDSIGLRVTPDTLTILRNQAVSEAVAQTRVMNDQLSHDIKDLSAQIVELKIILAHRNP